MTSTNLPPAWHLAIAAWLATETGAASTLAKCTKHLHYLARTIGILDPYAVTAEHLTTWLGAHRWASTTAGAYRASLRRFYTWATRAGHCRANPAEHLTGRHRPDPTSPLQVRPGPDALPIPPPWREPLATWARDMRAIGRPATTIKTRTDHLRRFARATKLHPFEVTFPDLVEWMADQDWSVETRRSYRSTFRVFYGWAAEAGHITDNPALRLPPTGVSNPNPRPAAESAYRFALLAAEPRERLMLRLAAEIGLRRAEVAQVHTRDLIEHDDGLSLLVHGKGSRDRVVPLPDSLAAALRDVPPGYVFPSPHGGHLSPRWVGKVVTRLLPAGVSMHALRHRFATRAYGLAHDVFAVQQLLGHASPNTTRRYVAVAEDRLRATVTALQHLDLHPRLEHAG